MNIKFNEKKIKEMCGTVSFKRGDSFYQAKKVKFTHFSTDFFEATVSGTEDFHVTIQCDEGGRIHTKCSCPKLVSYNKDCQHVAAVLIAICQHQQSKTIPIEENEDTNRGVTADFLNLFNEHSVPYTGRLNHFESRTEVDVVFTCKPIMVSTNQLLGIELKIGSNEVQHIRNFLVNVKQGIPTILSETFTFDPGSFCFEKESDLVMRELFRVIQDEMAYNDPLPDHSDLKQLIIPPSAWSRIFLLLQKVPFLQLKVYGETFDGLSLSVEPLPLEFKFLKEEDRYTLKVNGLHRLVVLDLYNLVLTDGKVVPLEKEDTGRLLELMHMIDEVGTNRLPIHPEQVNFFIEKVVPGLKKLGNIKMDDRITNQLVKTPLKAKLYLDRVNNKLLAGLEFCYENIVFNPLENGQPYEKTLLIRDVKKEASILKLMEDSSFAKTEEGYFLHNEELEYEFLYHTVPKLQQLVQIYATIAVKNRIFRESVFPRIQVKLKKERTNWLEFKFELKGISDNEIRDVLAALEEKRKYYRLRNGSLLSLEQRDFEEIQRFLKAVPSQSEDLEKGLNLPIVQGLRLLDLGDEQKIFTFEESFRRFLENISNPRKEEFPIPKSLEMVLRDYQKQGYQWMKTLASYGFGGILADDMGLGKTLQSITFIVSVLSILRDKNVQVLIICPSSLTYNWLFELNKFAPEVRAVVIDGNKQNRSKIQTEALDHEVIISSYPLLRSDVKWYEKQSFHTVFFDEAQAFKNPLSKTAKAVKTIRAENRFALTGTPVENSPEELWSIFHVVFPELFQGLKEYSHLSRKTIARRIRPFMLRRLKEDVLKELPEKIESLESVELLADQKKLYAAYLAKLRHDTLKHLDKDTIRKNRIKILAGLTRLRQICCHPRLFVDGYRGTSAKFEQLMQLLEEAKLSRRRVIIFSQFTKMLEIIGRELAFQGREFFYLDGQTPSAERVEICHRFNEGDRDLFLISLKAGGTGLNLTGADTVILYDIWWNPAVEEQAADRAHRIGQNKNVQVIKLVARGTIEEKMNELQEKKRNLIEEIIDSSEKTSTMLTEEDIREILMI
ncbi:MAG: DEAD/DEAH box helicase [Bacillota bacterium]|nr:DEAD/DEAH box helicase [Bacillota bacterium]